MANIDDRPANTHDVPPPYSALTERMQRVEAKVDQLIVLMDSVYKKDEKVDNGN